MANYKLPWNYEPGANNITITVSKTNSTGIPILTNYNSKWSDQYCFDSQNDSIEANEYQFIVNVLKANASTAVALSKEEQLKVSTTINYINNYKEYQVVYPNLSVTYTDSPILIAKPGTYYQLVKKTLENSSSWVDTSSWSNDTLSNYHYQCQKYFVPINTDINLNEEFKLRWWQYMVTIWGFNYTLPSTYYVDNTTDNFSYDSSDTNNLNPKVYDNGNIVNVLRRENGNWIMNIPSTGTYTLLATYTRNSNTLKPTMSEDVKDITSDIDSAQWATIIEAYDPSVAKVLSTELYTYRQQGYDWIAYKDSGTWVIYDDEEVLSDISFADPKYASFSYLNDAT